MLELVLYSTTHCHLCEKAQTSLMNLTNQYDIIWTIIEIVTDEKLLERYGVKIPVIKRADNDNEICWPFTPDDIIKLIITV